MIQLLADVFALDRVQKKLPIDDGVAARLCKAVYIRNRAQDDEFYVKLLLLSAQPSEGGHAETNAARPSFDALFIATNDTSKASAAYFYRKSRQSAQCLNLMS